MTTATAEATEAPPTSEDIERWTTALAGLREEAAELADRENELQEKATDAVADGEDPEEHRATLREVRTKCRELEAEEPRLEAKIRAGRMAVAREDARARLSTIKRRVGGLAGETPRRIERAEELAAELVDVLEWLATVRPRRTLLQKEARALADAAGLPGPDLKSLPADASGVVASIKGSVRSVSAPRDTLLTGDGRKAAHVLRSAFDEETPTPRLLEILEDADG